MPKHFAKFALLYLCIAAFGAGGAYLFITLFDAWYYSIPDIYAPFVLDALYVISAIIGALATSLVAYALYYKFGTRFLAFLAIQPSNSVSSSEMAAELYNKIRRSFGSETSFLDVAKIQIYAQINRLKIFAGINLFAAIGISFATVVVLFMLNSAVTMERQRSALLQNYDRILGLMERDSRAYDTLLEQSEILEQRADALLAPQSGTAADMARADIDQVSDDIKEAAASIKGTEFTGGDLNYEEIVTRLQDDIDNIEREVDTNFDFDSMLSNILPRVLLAGMMQVIAFFFLSMYKSNIDEMKYFQNELTNLALRSEALHRYGELNPENRFALVQTLATAERNFALKDGERLAQADFAFKDLAGGYTQFLETIGMKIVPKAP